LDPGSFALGALAAALLIGAAASWAVPWLRQRAQDELRDHLQRAAEVGARERLHREQEELGERTAKARRDLEEQGERLRLREDALDRRIERLEDRERDLHEREAAATGLRAALEAREAEVDRTSARQLRELERISGLRREEAEHLLIDRVERSCQEEAERALARVDAELAEEVARRARDALLTALQRTRLSHAGEALVSTVALPSDDLKGAIVGRDARNVRAFEEATGVDLIVDDTPGLVVVSAFDPVRREVARRALVRLLDEGRIHPPRIEVVVAETRQELEEAVQELGRRTTDAAGVQLPQRLETLLGRLEFVSEGGQSVRQHALETAALAAALASELGLDPEQARRAGLLHDVGKAVEHETGGGHAAVGAEAARRAGEDPDIVNAVAAHHGEVEATSPYAVLVQVANRLSEERPGARDGQVDAAIRRREELEAVARRHPGVERAWAVQAGRELRLVVDPARVSDKASQRLARDVARAVGEAGVGTPGEVKVTVVRPFRAEEPAG